MKVDLTYTSTIHMALSAYSFFEKSEPISFNPLVVKSFIFATPINKIKFRDVKTADLLDLKYAVL